MSSGVHNASAAAAGYLYQVRWALLNLLRNAPTRPDLIVSLEMHDDVAWEDVSGRPTELLQTKLHAKTTAGLSDAHADVWKTLLIWSKRPDAADPNGPDLALVTTSTAPPGTAASALRPGPERDVAAAVRLLSTAAASSTAIATQKGRERFLAMSEADRTILLNRVQVLDAALPLEDLDEAVRNALVLGLPSGAKAQARFVAEVWRWWDAMTIEMLTERRSGVAVAQLLAFVHDLRDGYGPDSLPNTIQRDDVTDIEVEGVQDERFVHQMRLVRYPTANLRRAVIDYHRALKQETQWLDDDLLGLPELRTFEEDLRDEWQRAFTDMLDDLSDGLQEYDPASVDDAVKVRAGKELLRSLLDSTAVSVRQQYTDPFFARGKRHELANRDHTGAASGAARSGADDLGAGTGIGWHPDFIERLTRVVTTA